MIKQRLKLSLGATVGLKRALEYFAAVNSGNALDYYMRHHTKESYQLRYDIGLKAVQDLQELGFTFEDVKTLVKLMGV